MWLNDNHLKRNKIEKRMMLQNFSIKIQIKTQLIQILDKTSKVLEYFCKKIDHIVGISNYLKILCLHVALTVWLSKYMNVYYIYKDIKG